MSQDHTTPNAGNDQAATTPSELPPARPAPVASGADRAKPSGRGIVLVACLLAFGLLIWARLLLVTNYPRTAVARPQGAAQPRPVTPQGPAAGAGKRSAQASEP